MLTIIETDQEGSASETEEGLGTIQEAEEYGQLGERYQHQRKYLFLIYKFIYQ